MISVFAGGMRTGPGRVPDVQTDVLWRAFEKLGLDAITLSSEDLPDLERLPKPLLAVTVLANVTDAEGKALTKPVIYKNFKTASGRSVNVAFIGVLGQPPFNSQPNPKSSPPNLPWRVTDPAEAVKSIVPEARKKADLVVVLYGGIRAPAKEIAQAVPGIDIMVAGREPAFQSPPEKVGETLLVQNADRGRYGAALGLILDDKKKITGSDQQFIALDKNLADAETMTAFVQEYRERLADTRTQPAVVQPASQSAWAGSQACASCHGAQFRQWKDTPHAHAMETLEKKDNGQPARRADCVACHTVAFDKPGGFSLLQARAELKGVGCESCHGAGAAHVKARTAGQATARLVKDPGQAVCVTCHNPDNSPNFDFATYHPRIVHTARAAASTTGVNNTGTKKL